MIKIWHFKQKNWVSSHWQVKLKWITELASCIQLLKMGTMNHPFIQKGLWSRSRRAGQGTGSFFFLASKLPKRIHRFAVACSLSTNAALIWKRSYNEMWAQLTPKNLSFKNWIVFLHSNDWQLKNLLLWSFAVSNFLEMVTPWLVPCLKVSLTKGYLVVKAGGYRTANSPLAKSVLLLPAWTSWHGCFSFLMGLSMLR